MSSEVKIKTDRGALIKSADGKVTLGGNAGCVTWGLIVAIGLTTLGAGTLTISSIFKYLSPNPPLTLGGIIEALGVTVFLWFGTYYLFNNARRGKVTIDPSTKLMVIGKREISFAEVETITSRGGEVPFLNGAIAITFFAVLKTGEEVSLGSISGNSKKTDERVSQILTILGEAIAK